nr:trafficking protein particle complex subunit 11 [Quercus suber]
MEDYPRTYIEHNLPLIIISGLGDRRDDATASEAHRQESGVRIFTSSPDCQSEKAHQLLQQFLARDGSEQPWNAASLPGPVGALYYRMKSIGRHYSLPSRKAAPLAQSPNADGIQSPTAALKGNDLHSPLSPLSPSSPIFPDGLFTPLWFTKHQDQVPALFLAFFEISTDDANAQNEQVQIDINAIRTALARSGYKTRFAAVLMSDKSILQAPGLEERLSVIRRATALDPKTGFFFMPPMSSQAEIATFVQSILTTFQPLILEYYRDMTKHSRRKKARSGPLLSSTSSMGSSSQTLSSLGWNARYEVKQGVLAEFRQEMESAERFYSSAIEELFHPEGVFETTPSWSPKWNEARLLCDALAIRILRCELWTGLTTSAVTSWANYRARTRDLIDRRGKGSDTYSWAAWESRWARTMAQLVARAQIPNLTAPQQGDALPPQPYTASERVFERLLPFHFLHHAGYWHRLAADALRTRQQIALALPEEDRIPQDQLRASAMTSRNQRYDRYLVPDSSEEYACASGLPVQTKNDHLIARRQLTSDAAAEFNARGAGRMTERLRLEVSRDMVKLGRHSDALDILLPMWESSSWRNDDWQELFGELLSLLHTSAKERQDAKVVLVTAWERLGLNLKGSQDFQPDLETCLDGLDMPGDMAVALQDAQRQSPFAISFAFADNENYVGESLTVQLTVISRAPEETAMITLSELNIDVAPKQIKLSHNAGEKQISSSDTLVDLSEYTESGSGAVMFEVPLTFFPGQRRVFNFRLTFREAQFVRLKQVSLVLQLKKIKLEHVFTNLDLLGTSSVFTIAKHGLQQKLLSQADATAITIRPKPPKMQLIIHGLRRQYYTDERLHLDIKLLNEEGEDVKVLVITKCIGPGDQALLVHWDDVDSDSAGLQIAEIKASQSHFARLSLKGPIEASAFTLTVEAKYTMASDADAALSKSIAAELKFVNAFDAIFELRPLLDPSPWPSYFVADTTGTKENPTGIGQSWRLGAKINSQADGDLLMREMRLVQDTEPADARCVVQDHGAESARKLTPTKSMSTEFAFSTRKLSIDDHRPTSLDLSLEVSWSRSDESETTVTSIPVPRLVLSSSEPRVLCTVSAKNSSDDCVALQYHLENPSMHFLTFALTMDASEEFAFSGPKYQTLSLAPMSRHHVEYRLLAHTEDGPVEGTGPSSEGHWIWPSLQVVDSYYQKNLKIHSGGIGVKIDETRGLGVLVN